MKRVKAILAICICFGFSTPVLTNETAQLWVKVRAKNKFERSVLANMGMAIEATREDFVFGYVKYEEFLEIEKLGWIEESFALQDGMDFPVKDSEYHNYDELTTKLKSIENQYSQIAKLKSIGKSTEGRDIWSMRISGNLKNSDNLPGIIFMGGHHAREHLSVETPLRLMMMILAEYQNGNQRIRKMLDGRDIHFIPAVNPDGLEWDVASGKYKMWRKNRTKNKDGTYGVDLNRNYGYQWGTGGSSNIPASDVYMGTKAFSEPETMAIKKYVETHSNTTILLSFHTYSELILYPWGHTYDGIAISKDKQVHEVMAKKMAQWNGYTPQQSSELYIASGDTTDWSYGEHKIISFTFELDPANQLGSGGFYPGAGVIPNVVKKNTEPILYLIELADNPYRALEPNQLEMPTR